MTKPCIAICASVLLPGQPCNCQPIARESVVRQEYARHIVRGPIHTRGSLSFARRADGAVVLSRAGDEVIIPANEWASVVSSVSMAGEDAITFGMALALHTAGTAYDPEAHTQPTHVSEQRDVGALESSATERDGSEGVQ